MKHFAEMLLTVLVVALVVLAYSLVQIVTSAIHNGSIITFAVAYALGFITPVVLYIELYVKRSRSPSALNTTLDTVKTRKCPHNLKGRCSTTNRNDCPKKRMPLTESIFCYYVPVVQP